MSFFNVLSDNAGYFIFALLLVVLILLGIVIFLLRENNILKKKYARFMAGKNGKSLEDSISAKLNDIQYLMDSNKENRENIQKIFCNLDTTLQKVGVVKYDAFHEMGGKLSFSLALLDKENTGFIINAMHSREGCYTYIKDVIKGNSVILLSEEEKEALEEAMK